jgi:hypothetical protein
MTPSQVAVELMRRLDQRDVDGRWRSSRRTPSCSSPATRPAPSVAG